MRRWLASFYSWLTQDHDSAPSIWLEKQIFMLRWLGIFTVIPVLMLLPMPWDKRTLMLAFVVFAVLFNSAVPWLVRYRPDLVMYLTSMLDTLASAAFMLVAGFNSDLYIVLFAIVVAISMRLGLRMALGAVCFVILLHALSTTAQGLFDPPLFLLRSFFLVLVAILSATLYQHAKRGELVLRRVNEQLQSANEELLKLDELKSNFISNVSHELRTPLTSIRAFSELGLTSAEDPAVIREFFGIINTESERLTRLVNDVLDIMKIESGKMVWQTTQFDLATLLQETARLYIPLFEQRQLEFVLDLRPGLPTIEGDRDRLQQVVSNLLGNALKFTPSGKISLEAWTVEQEIRVAISDSGIGIPPEEQGQIFEKFQQVGALLTDKPHGSGLGLAICQEIVEHHRGRIWVSSSPGQGSTFTFSLPIPSSASAPSLASQSILFVAPNTH